MRKIFIAFGGVVSSILVIALFSLLLFGPTKMTAIVIIVGAAHVVILGIPTFAILYWLKRIRLWTSILAGFLCGAIPTAYATRNLVYGPPGSYLSHGFGEDEVITKIDGVATAAGWLEYIMAFAIMGAFGAVAALVFWSVWSRSNAH